MGIRTDLYKSESLALLKKGDMLDKFIILLPFGTIVDKNCSSLKGLSRGDGSNTDNALVT
jgi:hypothetical protein